MKKKQENYLEKQPKRNEALQWSATENGEVTLAIENCGLFNRIAQKLFRKPKVSYVHLDAFGSFLWSMMDGEKNLIALGEMLKERFGNEAEPLYERLAQFMQILDSYGFVHWND